MTTETIAVTSEQQAAGILGITREVPSPEAVARALAEDLDAKIEAEVLRMKIEAMAALRIEKEGWIPAGELTKIDLELAE